MQRARIALVMEDAHRDGQRQKLDMLKHFGEEDQVWASAPSAVIETALAT